MTLDNVLQFIPQLLVHLILDVHNRLRPTLAGQQAFLNLPEQLNVGILARRRLETKTKSVIISKSELLHVNILHATEHNETFLNLPEHLNVGILARRRLETKTKSVIMPN